MVLDEEHRCSCSFWVKPVFVKFRKMGCLQVPLIVVFSVQIKFMVKLEQMAPLLTETTGRGKRCNRFEFAIKDYMILLRNLASTDI